MNADFSLLQKLPPLSRARGDRLYQHGERWWVDLFKENGAFLWGRRPGGVAHDWKNQLDKGLGGLFPSVFEKRLGRHLQDLFPFPHRAVFFRNPERAMAALESVLGEPVGFHRWFDPALDSASKDKEMSYWRPYLATPDDFQVLYPLLPWAQAQARVLLFSPGYAGEIPTGDLVPPTELAALVRSVVMTIADASDPKKRVQRESFWAEFDSRMGGLGLFSRRGPYLQALCEPEEYEGLFVRCLDSGFLLSPDMSLPSLLPSALSDGEWKAWLAACGPGEA